MQRLVINTLSRISPGLMAKLAYRQLTSPQISKLRTHEIEVLDKAAKERIDFQGFEIQTYHWDTGGEPVLLVHGWEGQAGNFADIIDRLIAERYSVFAFDGPSHGFSSKGRTSLFEFSDLVVEMLRRSSARKLISHSFGGVASTYALARNRNIEIDRYALLTTPDKFSERIADVAEKVGITSKVQDLLIERIEDETQLEVSSLNVSNFAPKTNVKRALILHGEKDSVIPMYQSRNVAANWEVCDFETIPGAGHFRILRMEQSINRLMDFLY